MTDDHKQKYSEIIEFEFFTEDLFSQNSVSITIDELCDLFYAIGVQNSIDNLLQVVANFSQICELIPSICNQPKWLKIADKISDLADTAQIILLHKEFLGSRLKCINTPLDKKSNDAFYGLTDAAPLYVTLGFLPDDRSHLDRYYQLIAHVLLARMVLVENQQLETNIQLLRDSLLEIRRTAREKALNNHPDKILDPQSYSSCLNIIEQEENLKSTSKYISTALSYMATTSLDKLAKLINTDPIDPKISIESQQNSTSNFTTDSTFHLDKDKNQPDNDMAPTPEGLIYFFPTSGIKSPANIHIFYIAKQIAGSRAMEHQLFINAWDNLNQNDITILLDYLFNENDCNEHDTLATKVAIGLMLFASFPAARISEVQISYDNPPTNNVDCYVIKSKTLRTITMGPKYEGQIPVKCIEQSYPRQQFIDLNLPIQLKNIIDQYLKASCDRIQGNLFTLSPSEINGAVNCVFSKLKYGHKKRLTPVRVQKYLPRIISRLPGSDISTSSIILGKEFYLSRTPIYYAAFDLDSLQHRYNHACKQILIEAGYPCEVHEGFPSSNTYLGCRVRPQLSVVKELADNLHNQVQLPSKRFYTLEKLANYHNAYTLYTWFVQCFCSGYRGVNIPYITKEMIDEHSGLAVIRDKDSRDFYHSRLVLLPECCLIQLRHYRLHIEQILSLSSSIPAGKGSKFFFIDPKSGSLLYPSRSQISKQLQQFNYHLPPNVQRHFLKGELQEDGCRPGIVELLLGHWNLGQEGWVETSALNPCDYRDEIQHYLPSLLRKINLLPIDGLKTPPKIEVSLSLSQWHEPTVSKKNYVVSQDLLVMIKDSPPSYIWGDDKDSEPHPIIEKFSQQQLVVLTKLKLLAPELYRGDRCVIIENGVIKNLLKSLKPKNGKASHAKEKLIFFIKGLELGKEELDWDVDIPHYPIVLPKGDNRIRPIVMIQMAEYRKVEQMFMADLEQPLPDDNLLKLGQIVISAILYGGINHKIWANAFWNGLTNSWCYQWQDLVWIDLWADHRPESELDQWDLQRNASQYRRWLADPLTQLLLIRLVTTNNEYVCSKNTSLKQAYDHYAQHLSLNHGTALPSLDKLLKYANAWSTLHVPPFLSAYMENKTSSTSLPDPTWLRIITGKHYPRAHKPQQTIRSKTTNSSSPGDTEAQIELIKQLCKGLAKKESQSRNKVISWIESFIEKNNSKLGCCSYLLAKWAIQLLSYKQSPLELRQTKPEKISTAQNYVTTIYKYLLDVAGAIDLFILDEEELHDLVAVVLNKMNTARAENPNTTNLSKQLERIVDRLNQFLGFIHVFHNMPLLTIDSTGDDAFVTNGVTVRANIMTISEFERLKQILGWRNKDDLNRVQRMALVWAILAFRSGLRVSEIYGLMIGDIQGNNLVELLIQPNHYRQLKSTSSERRAPLYNELPEDELDFVIKWQQYRKVELGSQLTCPLFTRFQLEEVPCPRDKILKVLAPSIKQSSGDISMTCHCLRHSFASNMLIKLIKNKKCQIKYSPEFLKSEEFNDNNIERLKKGFFANETLGSNALYLIANLLGHSDTETEITSYMHCSDWLCWHLLRHPYCLPPLTKTTISQLTGREIQDSYKIIKIEVHYLAEYVSKLPPIIPPHPLEESALDVKDLPKTTNIKSLEFADVLHQTFLKNIDYSHWPKNAAEVQVLNYWHDHIVSNISDKELRTTAKILIDSYNRINRTYTFYCLDKAKRSVDLLERLGAKLEYHHSRPRWRNPVENKDDCSLDVWKKTLQHEIIAKKSMSGRRSDHGKLSILIVELKIKGVKIDYNREKQRKILINNCWNNTTCNVLISEMID